MLLFIISGDSPLRHDVFSGIDIFDSIWTAAVTQRARAARADREQDAVVGSNARAAALDSGHPCGVIDGVVRV